MFKKIRMMVMVALVALIPLSASAQTNIVDDQARLYSTTEKLQMAARMKAFERYSKGVQVVVLTTNELQKGDDFSSYAIEYFNRKGIGSSKTDNGLLVLIAPSAHKTFIATGSGIEGAVTDLQSSEIAAKGNPYFQKSQWFAGTQVILAGLIDVLVPEIQQAAESATTASSNKEETENFLLIIFGIMVLVGVVYFIWAKSNQAHEERIRRDFEHLQEERRKAMERNTNMAWDGKTNNSKPAPLTGAAAGAAVGAAMGAAVASGYVPGKPTTGTSNIKETLQQRLDREAAERKKARELKEENERRERRRRDEEEAQRRRRDDTSDNLASAAAGFVVGSLLSGGSEDSRSSSFDFGGGSSSGGGGGSDWSSDD